MTSVRACPWLTGRRGTAVTMAPAAWWLALTRNPRAMGYKSTRIDGLKFACREEKVTGQ